MRPGWNGIRQTDAQPVAADSFWGFAAEPKAEFAGQGWNA